MPLLTMLATLPLLKVSYKKKKEEEEYFILRLFGLWTICQVYITLNTYYRLPIGLSIAVLIACNSKINKSSKLIAFILGALGFLASSIIYVIFY